MTTRDKQIKSLTEELTTDKDQQLTGRDKVNLLKALMLDQRAEEKLQLEAIKFQWIKDRPNLLTQKENVGPYWADGPQGLNRRLLDCDKRNDTNTADGTTG